MAVQAEVPGGVLVALEELLDGARLARACRRQGLVPVVAFTAEELLETLDQLAVEAVVTSTRLAADPTDDLVAAVRRRSGAPLVLLCGEGEHPPRADLRVDASESADAVARRVRELVTPLSRRTHVWGALRLKTATREAWWGNVPVALTPHQFVLLHRLLAAQGAVVAVDQLAEAVYGQAGWHDKERIHTHVRRLRRRLARAGEQAAAIVATTRGVGFRLREPPGAEDLTAGEPGPTGKAAEGL